MSAQLAIRAMNGSLTRRNLEAHNRKLEIGDSAEEDNADYNTMESESHNHHEMEDDMMEEEEEEEEIDYSDFDSDEEYGENEEVDPQVKEDMKKFQETFIGIKDRFKLINRIGEGTYTPYSFRSTVN